MQIYIEILYTDDSDEDDDKGIRYTKEKNTIHIKGGGGGRVSDKE